MNKWHLINKFENYTDYTKEVLSCDDTGYTSLDVTLTFNAEGRYAYMTVAWHNNDGNTFDLHGERPIEWDAALRLIEADVEIPEELK